MLMPKRIKHRKQMRGKIHGNATCGNTVVHGDYGLQSMEPGWITARQIEAARVAGNQYVSGEGRLFIRIFPDKPVSAKPLETRMGKGKGDTKDWVAVVKPGTVMYEVSGVGESIARDTFARMSNKLPVQCRMVERKYGT